MTTNAPARPRRHGKPVWFTPALWIIGFALFSLFVIWNQDLYTYLRYLALGLPQGAIIALIAVGYSMVYGIIQLINFAHGEIFMMSTYFALMFMVPVVGEHHVALNVVTAAVALMAACTAWVALGNMLKGRAARTAAALAVGAAAAALNFFLVPRDAQNILPFWVAVAVALVYSCCLGVTMDLLAYRPLRNSPRLIPLITAIGISLFLQNFAQAIWGSARQVFTVKPEALTGRTLEIAKMTDRFGNQNALTTTLLDVVIIVVTIVLLVALQSFIHYTRTGKAMRACAQDRITAGLMGIQTNRVVALAFALGAALAAVAAPLYVLRGTQISPTMGYIVGILAFASAVLGGIGNITGAMLGGLIIGIIFTYVPMFDTFNKFRIFDHLEAWGLVSQQGWSDMVNSIGSPGQYQLGVAYAFMILIIVFKPTGLLGKASAKRA